MPGSIGGAQSQQPGLGGDAGAASQQPAPGGATGSAPTFTMIYDGIIAPLCAASCHQAETFLNFTTRDRAYSELINKPPSSAYDCASSPLLLVVPSQPEQSLLVQKLRIPASCGQTMPYGGSLSEEPQVQIQMWIAAGALNN
jgi:hypothetical protein